MNILLIEPDMILGQTYKKSLDKVGHQVKWLRDAQSAILSTESTNQWLPDLVILELQLAKHNGVEFLYEFRSYDDLRSIPVMILSHIHPANQSISQLLWNKLGVVAYHYKPLTRLADLVQSVEHVAA